MSFNVDQFFVFLYMFLIRRLEDTYICIWLPINVLSEALN